MQFRVLTGDLSEWKADAIVHSASSALIAANPLSNKIQQKGGLSYSAACRSLGMCHVGSAVMTKGFKLKAPFVIHAVGPYWVGGKRGEETELTDAYKKALKLAQDKKLQHVAFASLCTREKRYPLQEAAEAVVPVLFTDGAALGRIDMVCESAAEQEAYTKAAVTYWLHKLSRTAAGERAALSEEAAAALALLPCKVDVPDPEQLAALTDKIKEALAAFLRLKRRSHLSVEHTAEKIMDLYAGVEIKAGSADATAAVLQPAVKRAARGRKPKAKTETAKKTPGRRGRKPKAKKVETVGQAIAAEAAKEEKTETAAAPVQTTAEEG